MHHILRCSLPNCTQRMIPITSKWYRRISYQYNPYIRDKYECCMLSYHFHFKTTNNATSNMTRCYYRSFTHQWGRGGDTKGFYLLHRSIYTNNHFPFTLSLLGVQDNTGPLLQMYSCFNQSPRVLHAKSMSCSSNEGARTLWMHFPRQDTRNLDLSSLN